MTKKIRQGQSRWIVYAASSGKDDSLHASSIRITVAHVRGTEVYVRGPEGLVESVPWLVGEFKQLPDTYRKAQRYVQEVLSFKKASAYREYCQHLQARQAAIAQRKIDRELDRLAPF